MSIDDEEQTTTFQVILQDTAEVGDDSSLRLHNAPGENQRKHIIQEGKHLTLYGDLFAVVHGTLTPDGPEATLIVIQFRFAGSITDGRRFKKVNILLKFANGTEDKHGSDLDPEVKAIAPDGEFEMAQVSTEEVSTKVNAQVSAPVIGPLGVQIGAGVEHGKTKTKQSRAKITGCKRLEGRRHGTQNTAWWKLEEDAIGKTGVPALLRTAMLVVPKTEDGFRAIVEVDASADIRYAAEVKAKRFTGNTVHPVYFGDERENFGPELVGVDPNNLAKCVLDKIGFIKTSTIVA
ncbi:hypothetical protein BDZ91DRAFT_733922 [Kalaharituber pfeilii]|nr:hypothetical protein BDZ91DRAFT_733922 [Kalaharituber pfeilii]